MIESGRKTMMRWIDEQARMKRTDELLVETTLCGVLAVSYAS